MPLPHFGTQPNGSQNGQWYQIVVEKKEVWFAQMPDHLTKTNYSHMENIQSCFYEVNCREHRLLLVLDD